MSSAAAEPYRATTAAETAQKGHAREKKRSKRVRWTLRGPERFLTAPAAAFLPFIRSLTLLNMTQAESQQTQTPRGNGQMTLGPRNNGSNGHNGKPSPSNGSNGHSHRGRRAFVTLVTRASYLPGVLTLAQTFREVKSSYPLVVFCTPALDTRSREILAAHDIPLIEVEPLKPKYGEYDYPANFRRFEETWNKLRAFELEEFERVVMMDSDMVVLRNMDELMDFPLPSRDWIAAAHACACNPRKFPQYPKDWIPENCAHSSVVHPTVLSQPPAITPTSPRPYTLLNSGLVIIHPSKALGQEIQTFLETSPEVREFQFPDQDLLSAVFYGRWRPLPYVYNALKTLQSCHPAMWRTEEVRCLHYIMDKPWENKEGQLHSVWWEKWPTTRQRLVELCGEEHTTFVEEHVTAI